MKRILAIVLVALMFGCIVPINAPVSLGLAQTYKVYLSKNTTGDYSEGVWQSNAIFNDGGSAFKYGLEQDGQTENKFLRLANFNGVNFSTYTSVNFALDNLSEWGSSISIEFSYRVNEGRDYYLDDDIVASVSVGGMQKDYTAKDLEISRSGDFSWEKFKVELPVTTANVADRLTLTYYYDGENLYTSTKRYMDVDNVKVTSSNKVICSYDMQQAEVSSSNTVDEEIDYTANDYQTKKQYLLDKDKAFDYSVNTEYVKSKEANFSGADVVALFPRGGAYMYRGNTSVNAGESDLYVLYDKEEGNSFLRMGNFNGKDGVTSSQFSMYFYDNSLGEIKNLPTTNRIKISFNYRLFVDEESALDIESTQKVLSFSTRSSSSGNSGSVSYDELIINSKDDSTWHTCEILLSVANTSTKYMVVYYYGYGEASFNNGVFMDMDNLTVCAEGSNTNYAYLNGSFEGMVPTVSDGTDALSGDVFTNLTVGQKGSKVYLSGTNYGYRIEKDQTVSLKLNWTPVNNVYNVTFDVYGEGEFDLMFGGRNGDRLSLTVGQSESILDGLAEVAWKKQGEAWKCNLYFIRLAQTKLYSLDVLNTSSSALVFDDIFIGEVSSVNAVAGNYSEFIQEYSALKETFAEAKDTYTAKTVKQINKVLYKAEQTTQFVCQQKLDQIILEIDDLIKNGVKKSNVTKLVKAIGDAEEVYASGGKKLYTDATWIKFENAYVKALNITEENSQEEVDGVRAELVTAINGLTLKPQEDSQTVNVALGVGGGVTFAGVVALGAFIIKRRKNNG